MQTLFNIVVEPCDCPNHSYQQKAELCHCLIFCHPQCIQLCCQVSEKLIIFRPHNPLKKWMQAQKNKKKKDEKKNRTSGKSWQSSKNRKKENCISPKQRNLRRTFEILLNSNKISSCVAGGRGRERKVQRPISKWQLSRGSTESAERGKNIGAYQRAKKKNKKSEVECRSKSDTWTGAVVNISKESWKEYWLRASAH